MPSHEIQNCNSCCYLSRRSSNSGQFYIYTCSQWHIESAKRIPYGVVKSSIGRSCPFYLAKPEYSKGSDSDFWA